MTKATPPRCLVRAASLALASCWVAAPAARAELMRYRYAGVVTAVHDPYGGIAATTTTSGSPATFGTTVQVGQPIAGTFAYDPAEPPNNSNPPPGEVSTNYGQIFGVGKPNADELTIAVDGKTFLDQTGGLSVKVAPGSGGAGMAPATDLVISNQYVDGSLSARLALSLEGASPALYPPVGPPAKLNLNDFQSAEFSASGWADTTFRGTIESLTLLPAATPEPSAGWIIGSAAAGYLARRRAVLVPGRCGPRSGRSRGRVRH